MRADRWWQGDLLGVDARAELSLLHDALIDGLREGRDPAAFVWGLSEQAPVALAELVAGSRAIANPTFVVAALARAQVLETVMSPSGLYNRIAASCPAVASQVLDIAVERHPHAPWIAKLSARIESVPGTRWLRDGASDAVLRACAEAGCVDALTAFGVRENTVRGVAALLRAGDVEACLHAAAVLVDRHPEAPVVGALAALVGPKVHKLAEGVADRVTSPNVAARIRAAVRGQQ